jgi:hypothetical protein
MKVYTLNISIALLTAFALGVPSYSEGAEKVESTEVIQVLGPAQFSYAAAKTAFATAQTVPLDIFSSEWAVIGNANRSNGPSSLFPDGYWPDGKFPLPGYSGLYRQLRAFFLEEDAFGNQLAVSNERLIGVETGRVYKATSFTWNFTEKGITATIPETDVSCEERVECRYLASREMLLCATTVLSTTCGAKYVGKIVAYTGLLNLSAH